MKELAPSLNELVPLNGGLLPVATLASTDDGGRRCYRAGSAASARCPLIEVQPSAYPAGPLPIRRLDRVAASFPCRPRPTAVAVPTVRRRATCPGRAVPPPAPPPPGPVSSALRVSVPAVRALTIVPAADDYVRLRRGRGRDHRIRGAPPPLYGRPRAARPARHGADRESDTGTRQPGPRSTTPGARSQSRCSPGSSHGASTRRRRTPEPERRLRYRLTTRAGRALEYNLLKAGAAGGDRCDRVYPER